MANETAAGSSQLGTQPLSFEDDNVWPVEKIVGEKSRRYKVRWEGEDPATGKRWPDSWVPLKDVTRDLIEKWEAEKERKKEKRRSSTKRASLATKAGRPSTSTRSASTSTAATHSRNKRATITRVKLEATLSKASKASPLKVNGKRKHSVTPSDTSLPDIATIMQEDDDAPPLRKKRKLWLNDEGEVDELQSSPVRKQSKNYAAAREEEEEEGSSDEGTRHSHNKTTGALDKGKGRAIPEFTVDSDDDDVVLAKPKPVKRKSQTSHPKSKHASGKKRSNSFIVGSDAPPVEPKFTPLPGMLGRGERPIEVEDRHPKAKAKKGAARKTDLSSNAECPAPKTKTKKITILKVHSAQPDDNPIPSTSTSKPKPTTSSSSLFTQRSPQNSKVASDRDLRPSNPKSKSMAAMPLPSTSVIDTPAVRRAPSPILSPDAEERLAEFDATINDIVDADGGSKAPADPSERSSTRAPSFMYGQSDVDPDAVELLYPPEIDEPPAKAKAKGLQRRVTLPDDSYEHDIVPETQSQPIDRAASGGLGVPLSSTPSRSSIISKMKPRTPGSAAGSKISVLDVTPPFEMKEAFRPAAKVVDNPTETKLGGASLKPKPLAKIPVLSPSKFAALLPPSSTIESAGPAEPDEPMSSIEQFDSPENKKKKERRASKLNMLAGNSDASSSRSKGKGKATTEDPAVGFWSGDIVLQRGQQLAEQAKLAKKQREGTNGWGPKLALDKIIAARAPAKPPSPSRSVSSSPPITYHNPPSSPPEADHEDEDERGSAESRSPSGSVLASPPIPYGNPPSSPPEVELGRDDDEEEDEDGHGSGSNYDPEKEEEEEEEDHLMQTDSFIDFSRGNDDTQMEEDDSHDAEPVPKVLAIPEEEEESTQDLLAEMEVQRAVSEGIDTPTPEPEEIQQPSQEDEDMVQDASMVPQHGTQQGSAALDIYLESSVEVDKQPPSLSPKPRSVPQPVNPASPDKRPVDGTQEIPPTASTHNQDSSQETNASAATSGSNGQTLEAAMSLLNVKSEEIKRLEKLLAEEHSRNEAMAKRIESLETELAGAQSQISARVLQTSETDTLVADLKAQLEQATSSHETEVAAWGEEKFSLELALKTTTERKDLADKDCSFFREQYMKASAYVTQMQSEKKAVEKEMAIAKSQATDGVAAIKALLDERIKTLEQDRTSWKRMAEFALEKDRRTNDDVRRRAAEEPELRLKCQKYKQKLAAEKEQAEYLKVSVGERDAEIEVLEGQVAAQSEENHRLSAEVEELKARVAAAAAGGAGAGGAGAGGGREQRGGYGGSYDASASHQEEEVSASSFSVRFQDVSMVDPNELVFRCEWRDGDEHFCNALFTSNQELEQHLYTSGHISPPVSQQLGTLD